jgi:hypothetical protein
MINSIEDRFFDERIDMRKFIYAKCKGDSFSSGEFCFSSLG